MFFLVGGHRKPQKVFSVKDAVFVKNLNIRERYRKNRRFSDKERIKNLHNVSIT